MVEPTNALPPAPRPDSGRGALVWGAVLSGLILALSFAAPLLAPYPPEEQLDLAVSRRRPPGTLLHAVALAGGDWRLAERVERTAEGVELERLGRLEAYPAEQVLNLTAEGVADRRLYLLGSDGLGRDLLSRMLYGGRVSLSIGLLAMSLALSLGILVGSAAVLGGPVVDAVLMRGVDALLAFPTLVLLLALAGLFGPSRWTLALILGGATWMSISRLTRGELLSLRERDFATAARATGLGPVRILVHHLLPNALSPVLVRATLLVADVILVESSLSFLRLGVQPPTPTWGNMIAGGRADLVTAWWISAFPGAALALTVISFNLLADGLRDLLDPRGRV